MLDIEGNPIMGEWVQFTLPSGSITYGGIYHVNESPSLQVPPLYNQTTVMVQSGSDGIARAWLKPGAFTLNKSDNDPAHPYTSSATGRCSVTAQWTNATGDLIPRTLDFTYKNYPYLSAQTIVSSNKIAVNDTVDVTLWLRGDGWSLLPTPIDVVLVCDRSGSMGT